MSYVLFILALFLIYSGVAMSLNVLVGFSGILSLTHAAFVGVGAYGVGILMRDAGLGWVSAALISLVLALVLSLALGWVALPAKDVYYIVVSFALQVIIYNVMLNWSSVTGGALGLSGVPRPTIGAWVVTSGLPYVLFAASALCVQFVILARITSGAYGRVLRAIREDDVAASVMGKRVSRAKVQVFVLCSVLAALGGTVLAPLLSYIHPTSFTIHETIYLLSMVIVGGPGNLAGPFLGSALLVAVPQGLSFTELGGSAAQLRQILYAVSLVLFIRFRPAGLLPEGMRTGFSVLVRKRFKAPDKEVADVQ